MKTVRLITCKDAMTAHILQGALENEGVRQIVSAEDVAELEEINIFECEMTRAGEYLLKEVRSSATLSSLIGVVCKDNFLAGVKAIGDIVPSTICSPKVITYLVSVSITAI